MLLPIDGLAVGVGHYERIINDAVDSIDFCSDDKLARFFRSFNGARHHSGAKSPLTLTFEFSYMKSAAVEAAYKPMSFIQHATTMFFAHFVGDACS